MMVKEIMSKDVITADSTISVKECAQKMVEENTKFLIIIEKKKLVGIVTEWDFVVKVVAVGGNPSKMKIEEIMTGDVIVVNPDTEISEAAAIMAKHNIKKLPIVTENVLIGVVTAMDILAAEPKMIEQISELILTTKKAKPVAG